MDEGKSVARREAGAHHHLEAEAVVAAHAVEPVRYTFGNETICCANPIHRFFGVLLLAAFWFSADFTPHGRTRMALPDI